MRYLLICLFLSFQVVTEDGPPMLPGMDRSQVVKQVVLDKAMRDSLIAPPVSMVTLKWNQTGQVLNFGMDMAPSIAGPWQTIWVSNCSCWSIIGEVTVKVNATQPFFRVWANNQSRKL